MTDPLTVLREFVIDAICDLPQSDYAPEYQALADIEALVQAARGVMTQMDYETPHHTRLKSVLALFNEGTVE